jgi:hypothetical protein
MKIATSNKSWILISTTVLIGIVFSVYFLVYVKGREKSMIENNFRVLQQIVDNIHSLQVGYENNAKASVSSVRYRRFNYLTLKMEIDPWWINKAAVNQELTPKAKSKIEFNGNTKLIEQQSTIFGQNEIYFKGTPDIFFSTSYQNFFNNPLIQRHDVFDQILILKAGDDSTNKVLYSNERFGKLKKDFYDTLQKASKFEIELNDTKYISFNHKIDDEQNIYISCLVLKSNFDQEKRSVSPFTISFLSIILMLIILAIPLLKLEIMNIQEQLHIRDIVFSIVSVLIGPAVFIVFTYTLIIFFDGSLIPKNTQDNLKNLSEHIETNFTEELESMAGQMDQLKDVYFNSESAESQKLSEFLNHEALKEEYGDTLGFKNDQSDWADFLVYPDALSGAAITQFKHFNYIFWTDNQARSRLVLSTFQTPSYGQDLKHRKYLTHIIDGNPIRFRGKKQDYEIAIESIKSVNDGTYEVGMGMSTGCDDCLLPVIATSTKMRSVMDVVMPEGFGYCIFDNDGNTMFHSDKMKNLNENFIEETNGQFTDHMLSGTSVFMTVSYNGKEQAVYLRPLSALKGHYIATFVNTQVFYSTFTIAVISAFIFFVSYVVLTLLLFALIFALTYKPVKLKQMVYGLSFTKPFETRQHFIKYKRMIVVMSAVIGYFIFTFLIMRNTHDFMFGELILVSGAVLVFMFISLSCMLPSQEIIHNIFQRNPKSTIWPMAVLIIGFAIVRAFYLLISDPTTWPMVLNAFLGVGVIGFAAWQTIFLKSDVHGEEILHGAMAVRVQRRFRLFMFLSVIVFSIIPMNLAMSICLEREGEVSAKYRALELLKSWERWIEAYNKDFKGKFTCSSELEFLESMQKNRDYISILNDSLLINETVTDAGAMFQTAKKQKVLDISDDSHTPVLFKPQVETLFEKIYKAIRPIYNERSRITSSFLPDASSNFNWVFYRKGALHTTDVIDFQEGNISLGRVMMEEKGFFRANWFYVILTTIASLLILFSFLRYILNKTYGFQFKQLAEGVNQFRSSEFGRIFLDRNHFSLHNSYNNIFVVGISVAHKNFIKDYFESQKDKSLFVFDLDNFYMIPNEFKPDLLNRYRDLIIVRKYPKQDVHTQFTWSEFEKLREAIEPPIYVLIDHFEFGYNDIQANKLKLHLLKDLVDSNRYTVIIKSEINATKLLNFYRESINKIEQLLQEKSTSNRVDLMDKHNELCVDYKKWQHIFGSFVKCVVPIDYQSDDNELKHGEFMGLLHKYLDKTDVMDMNDEDRILTIQQMSYPHYFSVWNSLAKEEKYLVYDIAKDRFVNTVNTNGIISLLSKGILVYDHSLRLMNESFSNFVLTAVSSEEALEMEMEARKGGSWNTAFPVILLVIVSLVIFLSIGQQSFLNDINAFLASIAALVGLLIRFSGFFSFGGKAPAT